MTTGLELSSYRFSGLEEYCLKAGSSNDIQLILIPPLFDEMNRMRRMIVDTMRLLDGAGIGTMLPDLPGTNESLFPSEKASLEIWQEALVVCLSENPGVQHIVSFRGGCLIDQISGIKHHWRLTPAKGSSLLRAMMRTRIASDKEAAIQTSTADLTEQAASAPIELAGNIIGPEMFSQLQKVKLTSPSNLRTARLENDSQSADVQLSGSALWLRAEPDADEQFSQSIADDITKWVRN